MISLIPVHIPNSDVAASKVDSYVEMNLSSIWVRTSDGRSVLLMMLESVVAPLTAKSYVRKADWL